jgi:hypothetical protein
LRRGFFVVGVKRNGSQDRVEVFISTPSQQTEVVVSVN